MEKDDDSRLMAQLKRGHKAALAGLVEKYKKQAYYLALGMVGNADDAFDISQEAFIRVYNSAGTFDETQRFFPWFYSIIANLCKNLLRKRQRTMAQSIDLDSAAHLLVDRTLPDTEMIAAEEKQRLVTALRKLSFPDREIINMNHFRMMSYEEIAEVLGIPKGTVMSRLYYARKRLAQSLEEV